MTRQTGNLKHQGIEQGGGLRCPGTAQRKRFPLHFGFCHEAAPGHRIPERTHVGFNPPVVSAPCREKGRRRLPIVSPRQRRFLQSPAPSRALLAAGAGRTPFPRDPISQGTPFPRNSVPQAHPRRAARPRERLQARAEGAERGRCRSGSAAAARRSPARPPHIRALPQARPGPSCPG